MRHEQLGVDAHGHQAHAVEADAHVGVDVLDAVLADHHDARHAAGDAALHLHEAVPAADAALLAALGLVLHLQRTVAGDGVVQRDDGGDDLLDAEDAVAEALVVVHEVELALALLQLVEHAHAEAERLAERALQVADSVSARSPFDLTSQ